MGWLGLAWVPFLRPIPSGGASQPPPKTVGWWTIFLLLLSKFFLLPTSASQHMNILVINSLIAVEGGAFWTIAIKLFTIEDHDCN